MTEQDAFEATRKCVAAAIEATADLVEVIEAPPGRTAAARHRLAATLRRIADGLERIDASPSPSLH